MLGRPARLTSWMLLLAACSSDPATGNDSDSGTHADAAVEDTGTHPQSDAGSNNNDAAIADAHPSDTGAGTNDGSTGHDASTLPDGCTGATPSFANDVVPILTTSCSGGEICHGGFGGKTGAYAQLVNHAADRAQCGHWDRVVASDLEHSYVMHKITGSGMCPSSQQMPLGHPLPQNEIQTIADWICSGAPNN